RHDRRGVQRGRGSESGVDADSGHAHRGSDDRARDPARESGRRASGVDRSGGQHHRGDARQDSRRHRRRPVGEREERGRWLAGGQEAWQIAAELARADVPVLVEPLDNIPSYDALGVRYENAGLLAKAGVKIALLETDTHNSRNLRQEAGNAVAYGMSWEQAL